MAVRTLHERDNSHLLGILLTHFNVRSRRASLAAAVTSRPAASLIAQCLGAMSKYVSVLFLPPQLALLWRTTTDRRRFALQVLIAAAVAVGSLVLLYEPFWAGVHSLDGLLERTYPFGSATFFGLSRWILKHTALRSLSGPLTAGLVACVLLGLNHGHWLIFAAGGSGGVGNKYAITPVWRYRAFRGDRSMKWLLTVVGCGIVLTANANADSNANAGTQRPVVELFTSQGCSSCPPADALVGRLAADPSLLVLSYHVNYWDDLGWKDSFSSQPSTDRQYQYARALRQRSVFTPQLILNGTRSLVGSQEGDVRRALTNVSAPSLPVHAELLKQADGGFNLTLSGPAVTADVWEVRYVRHAVTKIVAGENGGRDLETFNNVVHLRKLGAFQAGTLKLQPLKGREDGIAVLVQKPSAGEILGAAAYQAS